MLRVVIIGYGSMFTNLIAATLDANCKIVGVFRKEQIKYVPLIRKIKDIINPSLEYNYIKSYNLPEIEADSVNSEIFQKKILKLNPDIILVGSWSEKINKATYDLPKIATINAHPSLLPKYRGPNPYFWVLKNQEQTSGITFHLVDDYYDRGSILAQEEIKIYPNDTGESLKSRTVLVARGLACELLNSLKEDIIIPLQQQEEKATYFSDPMELELDFKKTAEENLALIKAAHPWCNAYFYHNITALVPDCFQSTIEENKSNITTIGAVVEVDYKTKTIAVLCQGQKVLKMKNVNLYKSIDKIFTKNYIKREIKLGDLIL